MQIDFTEGQIDYELTNYEMRLPFACLLPIAYCLLAAFPSCKNKTDCSKQIPRLDSAREKLKEAEKVFLSVDTSALRTSCHFAEEKLHLISEKISKDTVKKKIAMFLTNAYEQTGNILNFLENKKYLARALTDGQQRIDNLKHDLTEDLIEQNKSQEYIVNELNASQKISETVNKAIEKAKMASFKLDSLKNEITAIADSLNKK